MDGFDLRKYQTDEDEKEKMKKLMGKILSGREDYEAIIEKKKEDENERCSKCNHLLIGEEKFCPECGEKVNPVNQAD